MALSEAAPRTRSELSVVKPLERGSIDALVAQTAFEQGIPGIFTKVVKPKNGGQRFVEARITPEGHEWFTQISHHPLTRAARMLKEATESERDIENSPGFTNSRGGAVNRAARNVTHKKRAEAIRLRQYAKELLSENGISHFPRSDEESLKGLIGKAANEVYNPS